MNADTLFDTFPTLHNDSIELGKIEPAHLDDLHEIYSNDRVFDYCGIIPKQNKDTVKKMIGHFERDYNKKSRVKWGILIPDSSRKLAGIAEVYDINSKVNMMSIGYFLNEDYWGQGIATKAVQLLTRYLFEQVGVNRLQAEVMPANGASKTVLQKNGFMLEGTLRQATVWSGKGVVDLEIYGLLKEEYAASHTALSSSKI